MLSSLRLVWSVVVLGGCAGLAAAQWSVVETQQVEQSVIFGYGYQGIGSGVAFDGGRALVATSEADLSYVYEVDALTGAWTEIGRLSQGGYAVALSGDQAVVGSAPSELDGGFGPTSAYVFERDAQSRDWTLVAELQDPNPSPWAGFVQDTFGSAVALSGDTLLIGAPGNNVAYVFERDQGGPGAWGVVAELDPDEKGGSVGNSVALQDDLAFVGAPSEGVGAVLVYERSPAGASWTQTALLVPSDGQEGDYFGNAVAFSGTTALVGAPGDQNVTTPEAGAAYVFERFGNGWQETAKVVAGDGADDGSFGDELALDSDTAAIGAPGSGAVYVHKRNQGGPGAWGEVAKLPVNLIGTSFRVVVAVSGAQVAVGDTVLGFTIGASPGLAFDPAAGVLYGADIASDQLLTVDPITLEAALVGPIGFGEVRGLAFDPASGTLYGCDTATDQLIRIDTASGAGTATVPSASPGWRVWSSIPRPALCTERTCRPVGCSASTLLPGRPPWSAASGSPGSGSPLRCEHGDALWKRHQRQSVDPDRHADRERVDRWAVGVSRRGQLHRGSAVETTSGRLIGVDTKEDRSCSTLTGAGP